MYTESINDHQGMINIRALMGVCPQFDMLWDKLTADEHMEARHDLYRQLWPTGVLLSTTNAFRASGFRRPQRGRHMR